MHLMSVLSNFLWLQSFTANCSTHAAVDSNVWHASILLLLCYFPLIFLAQTNKAAKRLKLKNVYAKNTLSEVGNMARGEEWGEVLQTN